MDSESFIQNYLSDSSEVDTTISQGICGKVGRISIERRYTSKYTA